MKALFRLVLLALCAVALAGGYVLYRLNQPYKGFTEPVFVDFPHGTATGEIASELSRKGVLQCRWTFLAARALHRGARLQAGEYKFDKPATPLEIYGRITRGDIYYVELLVPEGFNIFEIAGAIAKLGMLKSEAFLAAAKNPAMIRDLDPKAESLEGYLFPNKYRVYRHTTAPQLCRQMTNEFRAQWRSLATKADAHDTVTLASLVEREAKLPKERPEVASVFHNRLRIGMKLDCDPTTVYAALLENRYRGTIYRSDLESTNPYNTYQKKGLPPGPIASPGLGAIQAALAPAETPFLYFVAKADGSGGHNFSDSLARHEAAVASYRRVTHR